MLRDYFYTIRTAIRNYNILLTYDNYNLWSHKKRKVPYTDLTYRQPRRGDLSALAKWKEVQAYYNLTTNVEVLGKKMSLVEAENSIIPFQKMQNIWTNFIHQTETQNLLARLLKEPSIPTATEQRKNFAKVVGVFQTAVQKARSTVITVTMSKDFLE